MVALRPTPVRPTPVRADRAPAVSMPWLRTVSAIGLLLSAFASATGCEADPVEIQSTPGPCHGPDASSYFCGPGTVDELDAIGDECEYSPQMSLSDPSKTLEERLRERYPCRLDEDGKKLVRRCKATGNPAPSDAECDMTGTWLSLQRSLGLAPAVGVAQTTHTLQYWEIEQIGDRFVATRSMTCGKQTRPEFDCQDCGTLDTGVSYTQRWQEGNALHSEESCRAGTFRANGNGGCEFTLDRGWEIRGATWPEAYTGSPTDTNQLLEASIKVLPSEAMPTEAECPGTPGLEDWDDDGHPGVTLNISGLIQGELHVVQRRWWQAEGGEAVSDLTAIPPYADQFRAQVTWDTQQNIISNIGISISAESQPHHVLEEHYVEWFRLTPRQAAIVRDGDDLMTCARANGFYRQLILTGGPMGSAAPKDADIEESWPISIGCNFSSDYLGLTGPIVPDAGSPDGSSEDSGALDPGAEDTGALDSTSDASDASDSPATDSSATDAADDVATDSANDAAPD